MKQNASKFVNRMSFRRFNVSVACSAVLLFSSTTGTLTAGDTVRSVESANSSTATAVRELIAAIKKEPAKAAELLAKLIKARKTESCEETARFVAAAIAALGKNPPREIVLAIVQKAILIESKCAPAIVGAAVKASPAAFAANIVEVAIATVGNPGQLIGGVTLAEAIVNAALEARPGLDPGTIAQAAELGLEGNISTVFANSLPGNPTVRPNLNVGGSSAIDNPNFSAFENAMDQEDPVVMSRQ